MYPYKYILPLWSYLCLESHCNLLFDLLLQLYIMVSRLIPMDTGNNHFFHFSDYVMVLCIK